MANISATTVEERAAEYDKLLERLGKVRHIERIPLVNKMIGNIHQIVLSSSTAEVNILFSRENNARTCKIFRQLLERRLSDPSAAQSDFLQTYTRFTSLFRDVARQYNEKISDLIADSGIFERILRELGEERLQKARFVENVEYGQFGTEEFLLRDYYVIMTNLVAIDRQNKSDAIARIFVREKGFLTLLPYLQGCGYIQISTIFFLAMMVTDDTKETLNQLATDKNLQLAVAKLRNGMNSEFGSKNRRHAKEGFNVALLFERCNDLMHCGKDSAERLFELGIFEYISTIILARDIQQRTAAERQKDGVEYKEPRLFCTEQELTGALKCCLTLCFTESGIQRIKESTDVVSAIMTYSHEHANQEIRLLCANIILQIDGEKLLRKARQEGIVRSESPSPSGSGKSTQQQVMISYNWAHQQLALRIRDALKQAGVAVWIDVDCMRGNIVEQMAAGVESSDTVVMLFSRGYHQSSPCQSEANFAYKLKRQIIPVKVESYEPSGWLGLIIAGLLYYDMSEESTTEQTIARLVQHVVGQKDEVARSSTEHEERSTHSHSHSHSHSHVNSGTAQQQTGTSLAMVQQWKSKEVADWISKLGSPALTEKLSSYDGHQLSSLIKIRRESLQLFLKFVETYNLPNGDILRLIAGLDQLDAH